VGFAFVAEGVGLYFLTLEILHEAGPIFAVIEALCVSEFVDDGEEESFSLIALVPE
jgi:hypothetical protein